MNCLALLMKKKSDVIVMNNPLISVIVPIYNGEKYLKECVDSIINQSYKNLEILLVDDGSSDASRTISQDFRKTDSRIHTVFRDQNGGVSECRLTGVAEATGEWVIFVDHDDIIPVDTIETFIDVAQKDEEIEVVCGDVGEKCERDPINDPVARIDSGECIIQRYFTDSSIRTSHESKLYKKSLLVKVNVEQYRTRCPIVFFDDILITPIILGAAKKVAILSGVYYLHREVPTSISRSGLLNSFMFDHMEAGDIMLQYFSKNDCAKSYSIKLSRYFQDILRVYCLMDYYNIELERKQRYEKSIISFYKKYRRDYCRFSSDTGIRKLMFELFGINPKLWKWIVQVLYFKDYKKKHNL